MANLLAQAKQLDQDNPLSPFRDQFHIPMQDGKAQIYFVGNSLGLQPKRTADYVNQELENWQRLGVRGHFEGDYPWMPYHEFLTETMANLIGAKGNEVVTMNSLTTNLHLMMATFYRPQPNRYKILMEAHSFPSDFHAVQSQIQLKGFNAPDGMIQLSADNEDDPLSIEQISHAIDSHKDELAMILLPGVQYYTGQVFEMKEITRLAHAHDIVIGFDLAHAVGNIDMELHDWDVDFAVWCTYKYLNSGPGSVGGCFVHERHASDVNKKRLAGWWGHDKQTRFQMKNEFRAIPTAEGWQLSNPPILSLAAIRASLDVFKEAGGMKPLTSVSKQLTDFFEQCLIETIGGRVEIITPCERGCQLSLKIRVGNVPGKEVHTSLEKAGIETDWREPNVIRAAPVPLYNTFEEVYRFVKTLKECMQ